MGCAATAHDAVPLLRMPTLDMILDAHAAARADFEGYRNHAYRVANLCVAQLPGSTENVEKVAVAAGFHDLGIWTDSTFDDLSPSAGLARASDTGGTDGVGPEITDTVFGHHKVLRYRGRDEWLVEPFRRADWMDVSVGALRFGLSRRLFEAVSSVWPRSGFHQRLVHLALRRVRTHPWSPLPMVRL